MAVNKTFKWIGGSCLVIALVYLVLLVLAVAVGGKATAVGRRSVAVIHLDGVISGSSDGGLSGGAVTPEAVLDLIREAEEDDSIKAVLFRVNSPGGSAAASQEIYEGITRMKKPSVVSVADTCASGAYYISSACRRIIANRASEVGSIGVVMEIPNIAELYRKLGIKFTYIYKGKYKTMGAPDRALTAEERMILDRDAEAVYGQFIDDVARSRHLPRKTVRGLATGRTWNGSEALDLKLIDGLGNYDDGLDEAARLGGLNKGAYDVRQLEEGNPFQWLTDLIMGAKKVGALAELMGDATRRVY